MRDRLKACFLSLGIESELSDAVIQGGSFHVQEDRGLAAVALSLREGGLNQVSLEVGHGPIVFPLVGRIGGGHRRANFWVKVFDAEGVAFAENAGPFYRMAELADISRPGVFFQNFHCGRGDRFDVFAVLTGRLLEEEIRENGDVFTSLAERGNVDMEDVETIEEVFAEFILADEVFEVAVGSGEKSAGHVVIAGAADGPGGSLFQDSQEHDLKTRGDCCDFVEHEGSRSGFSHESRAIDLGAGEGSFDVSEQFTSAPLRLL